jgi:5-methyltetrahydrofolate--homocysteine methyltransferase
MGRFQELLDAEATILLDGAMGTMLMSVGLEQGHPPEEWNVRYPERVLAVHEGYIGAGSRLILTNSFGGTHFRLKLHDLQDRAAELNLAAAKVARRAADAAPRPVAVAGSMGPTGELLQPMGTMTFEEARDAFAEQAAALAEGGVDVFWIETMSDLDELRAALEGARSVSQLPVAASMTFDTNRHTMMGVSPQQAVEALSELDLVAFGANCGNGPSEIEYVIEAMAEKNPTVPLIAKSNAGIPQLAGDDLVYDGTPMVMAGYAYRAQKLGARLIGGCCGNSPDHVRAMAAALNGEISVEELPPPPRPKKEKKTPENGRGHRRRHRRRRAS